MFRFRREVYLANNATTKVSKHVRKKINYVLKYCYGNPSSLYKVARNSAEIMEEARNEEKNYFYPIEYASVLSTLEYRRTKGIKVEYCSVDDRHIISNQSISKTSVS